MNIKKQKLLSLKYTDSVFGAVEKPFILRHIQPRLNVPCFYLTYLPTHTMLNNTTHNPNKTVSLFVSIIF